MDSDESRKQPMIVSHLTEQLIRRQTELVIRDLISGDFAFQSTDNHFIGIERKAADNLMGSLTSGELSDQIRTMQIYSYDVSYVLVEGFLGIDNLGHMKTNFQAYSYIWEYWQAFKAEAQEAGVRFIESPNITRTSHVIATIYDYWQSTTHNALRVWDGRILKDHPVQVKMLAQIPGWGISKSQKALKHMHNLRAVLDASIHERCAIPGIGGKLAGRIDDVLNENMEEKFNIE